MKEFQARLRGVYPRLSEGQAAVARRILSDIASASVVSATQVAREVGVHPSTVVRTAQALGYRGWRDLQRDALVDAVGQPATIGEPTTPDGASSKPSNSVDDVFLLAMGNLADTSRVLDQDALLDAARQISMAGTTLIIAGGVSSGLGMLLSSSLQAAGCRSSHVTGLAEGALALAPLGQGDVAVAITVWRYLRTTDRLLMAAKERGLRTVAITDDQLSPAGLIADDVLVCRTTATAPRIGFAGMLTAIEALVSAVAVEDLARSLSAADKLRDFYPDYALAANPIQVADAESQSRDRS